MHVVFDGENIDDAPIAEIVTESLLAEEIHFLICLCIRLWSLSGCMLLLWRLLDY